MGGRRAKLCVVYIHLSLYSYNVYLKIICLVD